MSKESEKYFYVPPLAYVQLSNGKHEFIPCTLRKANSSDSEIIEEQFGPIIRHESEFIVNVNLPEGANIIDYYF